MVSKANPPKKGDVLGELHFALQAATSEEQGLVGLWCGALQRSCECLRLGFQMARSDVVAGGQGR